MLNNQKEIIELKLQIENEYESFLADMYAGKELPDRKELDQFFTPPLITIQMLRKIGFDNLAKKTVLDPCCGSGNLLVACILAGADPNNIYGNEYDEVMVELCRNRLEKYGVPRWHIHQGNALISDCLTQFSSDYDETILAELLKRRNGMSGGFMNNPDKYLEWKKEHRKNKEHAERTEQIVQEQENQTEEELW